MSILSILCFDGVSTAHAANPSQVHHAYVSEEVWQQIVPYLMPENHPLMPLLNKIFSKSRVLKDEKSLWKAGFEKRKHQPHTKVVVTRHKNMRGYIFKIYTDSVPYYRNEPEYITWMLRARGAKLIRKEIIAKGWQPFFKAPRKWIYALPPNPVARVGALQKNFILVEEEMDIISNAESFVKWRNGTATRAHLDRLFYMVTRLGLAGCCKFDNIPFCRDGKIAFIDTQNNLKWPIHYERLFQVLIGDLQQYWTGLMQNRPDIPKMDKGAILKLKQPKKDVKERVKVKS